MPKLRNIALAFADGFAPLDALLGGIERPGSRDNLISNAAYPSVQILARKLSGKCVTNSTVDLGNQGVRALVSSLRAKASEIESAAALNDNEPLGTTHGR